MSNKVYIFERTTDYLGKTVEQLKGLLQWVKAPAKRIMRRGNPGKANPFSKGKRQPMLGNIPYNKLEYKGFPAEIEGLPGVSSASSRYVDECSPSRLPG
ncbi:MAG: hypothetical protein WC277_09540, partial [Bacilli bacterium]